MDGVYVFDSGAMILVKNGAVAVDKEGSLKFEIESDDKVGLKRLQSLV